MEVKTKIHDLIFTTLYTYLKVRGPGDQHGASPEAADQLAGGGLGAGHAETPPAGGQADHQSHGDHHGPGDQAALQGGSQ